MNRNITSKIEKRIQRGKRAKVSPLKAPEILICDFETVVEEKTKEQTQTEVWADALVELSAPNEYDSVIIGESIDHFFNVLFSYRKARALFHNEKFDGSFILDYLLKKGFKPALVKEDRMTHEVFPYQDGDKSDERFHVRFAKHSEMEDDTFSTLISSKGIWYSITIKHEGNIYEIMDSYKILPFSVKKLGKDFKTQHQKTSIEYEGKRKANGGLTDQEKEYIANDVLVVKEALMLMYSDGYDKMTIGSCCMSEYKKKYSHADFKRKFPNLYNTNPNKKGCKVYGLVSEVWGSKSIGEYIRKAYKGGWCLVNPYIEPKQVYKADKLYNNVLIAGTTCDVNSLYPSMMISESGNRYPVGEPHVWRGDIPDYVKNNDNLYYFVRLRTRFYIKDKHLPTIQIKSNPLYHPREWLMSSDYKDKDGNTWRTLNDDVNGGKYEVIPELTLTKTDFEMLQKHYNLEDTEILDGVWFNTEIGLFDEYLHYWAEIKMNSTGAKRQEAKLFSNNLYGRFATSTDAAFKVPYINEKGILSFYTIDDESIDKGAFIPIGAAITSFARRFTVSAAQANIDVFLYSDTDSIHLLCTPDEVKGAPEHPTKYLYWKYETCWDEAIFVRAKTYIEHVTHENREEVEPYYNIKCAGMPDRAKQNFESKLIAEPMKDGEDPDVYAENIVGVKNPTEDEKAFYKLPKMTLNDFDIGLTVPGSLKPKRIPGGIILVNSDYVMRPSFWGN